MFSVLEKRNIAEGIQVLLRNTQHPELPQGEISFQLHVEGAQAWSWADIQNNNSVVTPDVNPWNEKTFINRYREGA